MCLGPTPSLVSPPLAFWPLPTARNVVPGQGSESGWRANVVTMGEPFRFDDIPPDEKILFLNRAREQHPDVDVIARESDGPGSQEQSGWGCLNCGASFPIDDVLVADTEPSCPRCGASGWGVVHPRGGYS